ncbi:Hypothetical predicted protein [Olea europaea subsp. europaea]|uniref:Uncharacterized protein n=1 Tax=Olea europaea subsp. europaea TaxID=158383 RepID=A0A8S0TMB1_OLEEU|nr:Hypothetical predicted protein [Olea europaea subsp. europaea]
MSTCAAAADFETLATCGSATCCPTGEQAIANEESGRPIMSAIDTFRLAAAHAGALVPFGRPLITRTRGPARTAASECARRRNQTNARRPWRGAFQIDLTARFIPRASSRIESNQASRRRRRRCCCRCRACAWGCKWRSGRYAICDLRTPLSSGAARGGRASSCAARPLAIVVPENHTQRRGCPIEGHLVGVVNEGHMLFRACCSNQTATATATMPRENKRARRALPLPVRRAQNIISCRSAEQHRQQWPDAAAQLLLIEA